MSSVAGGFAYLKKYLLKGIDVEKADSKGLKTLALYWVYRKRAFSVSGQFRKALTDLIMDLRNSKKQQVQLTLAFEKIQEEPYFLLGFVSSKAIGIDNKNWFVVLNKEQIALLDNLIRENYN